VLELESDDTDVWRLLVELPDTDDPPDSTKTGGGLMLDNADVSGGKVPITEEPSEFPLMRDDTSPWFPGDEVDAPGEVTETRR
jgi:hypothetical protein